MPKDADLTAKLPVLKYNQKFLVNKLEGGNKVCVIDGWYTQSVIVPEYHQEMECE